MRMMRDKEGKVYRILIKYVRTYVRAYVYVGVTRRLIIGVVIN